MASQQDQFLTEFFTQQKNGIVIYKSETLPPSASSELPRGKRLKVSLQNPAILQMFGARLEPECTIGDERVENQPGPGFQKRFRLLESFELDQVEDTSYLGTELAYDKSYIQILTENSRTDTRALAIEMQAAHTEDTPHFFKLSLNTILLDSESYSIATFTDVTEKKRLKQIQQKHNLL